MQNQKWKKYLLEEVSSTATGGTPNRKIKHFFSGKIPWVKSGELKDTYISGTKEKISEEAIQDSSAKVFPAGTLLIALYGATVGRTAILKIDAATNQAVCAIFPNKEILDTEFLRFQLVHKRTDFFNQRYGGAQPNISQTIIRNTKLSLPPLPEQKKIAHILSTVQRGIEQQERLIQVTTELKKTLMQKFFTEGLHGEPQKETEIGLVPDSWDVVRIGDECLDCAFGPRFSSKEYRADGEITTLRTTDMEDDGKIDYSKAPRANLELEKFQKHFLKTGDLVVSRSGTCGIAGVFQGYERPVLPGAFLIRLRMRDSVIPQFLRHYINSPPGRIRVLELAEGAIQKNISGTRLCNLQIPFPKYDFQKQISNNIDVVDTKIQLHVRKKTLFEDLFRTLLHQLMTAQIRVDEIEFDGLSLKGI